jgi:hypothetical protein
MTISKTLIRIIIAMEYDQTEIPTTYDKARALCARSGSALAGLALRSYRSSRDVAGHRSAHRSSDDRSSSGS